MRDPANPLLQTARSIAPGSVALDIGAGNGLLARIISRVDPSITVDGVEPSESGAAEARQEYRLFHNGYAEEFLAAQSDQRYDYVILNDVIEHVVDPVAFLGALREAAGASSRFLVSTPNVAYVGMRLHLMSGRFDYVDSGILERTHLRFFTLPTLLEVFRQSGFHPRRSTFLQRRIRETEFAPHSSRSKALSVARWGRDPVASTYQFLFLLEQTPGETEELVVGRHDTLGRMVVRP
jgi:2-polyprenyl-3-methyl-5-hydroxy-6-metoxy-1,4-benzoquinol methylase